jgi:hypothetical protein
MPHIYFKIFFELNQKNNNKLMQFQNYSTWYFNETGRL